ncbi:MAG: DUF1722 domain-containing protein [Mariprofundaceae bacterium]|nr:DUF1722 domain-containing protein [Mariprofundaceae bacterium]
MRIWDINPGYLNRQSLLGEHRELHGLVSIIVNRKNGYSRHPETIRWLGYGWALKQRHRELVCEMELRGYVDNSPVRVGSNKGVWPPVYIDKPHVQFQLLREKYRKKEQGRIPLPVNEQELWSHHKYSVLARDQKRYKEIGQNLAKQKIGFESLALELVEILRTPPAEGGIRNAVQHMWGHVSENNEFNNIEHRGLKRLLLETQKNAKKSGEPYINRSTALSELMAWL